MPQPEAETHQAGQALLAADLVSAVGSVAWPLFDPRNIRGSLPRVLTAIMALVHRYGLASAVHAAQFYKAERAAAGVRGRIAVPPAPLPSTEQVAKSLDWATSSVWGSVAPEDLDHALTNMQGLTQTLVLDMGRDTIIDTVQQDRAAKGWARVPEASACSFCLLLATRGAVYKDRSFTRSDAKFTGGGKFKVHDHCACTCTPVFSDYEPPAIVRQAELLYKDTPYGGSPQTARNNFRVALQRERDAGRI